MKALIVVDIQQGFINQYTNYLPNIIDDHIAAVAYDTVIFTQFINSSSSPFVGLLNWNKLTSASEQKLALTAQADLIARKGTYSAMTTEVVKHLSDRNIDTVYICGVDTDSCVLKTAFDAFDMGFIPKIIENLTFSTGGQHFHDIAIEVLKRSLGIENVIQA